MVKIRIHFELGLGKQVRTSKCKLRYLVYFQQTYRTLHIKQQLGHFCDVKIFWILPIQEERQFRIDSNFKMSILGNEYPIYCPTGL